MRRRLDELNERGDAHRADIRRRRLIDPGDEDWALTLLVSRTAPTPDQMAMLADLASDPGGIAALVPGGTEAPDGHPAPASFRLEPDPARPGGIAGHVAPLHLDVWPQPLTKDDYQALASLFQVAADLNDVAPDEPPYDGSSWPPAPELIGLQEPPPDRAAPAARPTSPRRAWRRTIPGACLAPTIPARQPGCGSASWARSRSTAPRPRCSPRRAS